MTRATPDTAAEPSPGGAPDAPTDESLVEAVGGGDRAALAELYDRHAPHVYTLARRILRCDADAESVVSDVFLQVWKKSDQFDTSRGAVRTYLLVMARSRALDRVRAATTRQERTAEAGDASLAESRTRQQRLAPDQQTIQAEHGELVRTAIASLDERQRTPLALAFYEGLTHREIAERLGEPLGTVKTRIRTAIQSLRTTLQAIGRHEDDVP